LACEVDIVHLLRSREQLAHRTRDSRSWVPIHADHGYVLNDDDALNVLRESMSLSI
jgi:hypothetical protein